MPASQIIQEMSRYIDLEAYNKYERTHPFYEEMLTEILVEVRKCLKKQPTKILELGAGTGIVTLELAQLPRVDITAVEIDAHCYAFLEKNLSKYENVQVIQGDMVTFVNKKHFDIVVSVFSHDHVHYGKRFQFAKNINKNLIPRGVYIMGDELIPKFTSEEERKKSLHSYHDFIIGKAKEEGHNEIAELEKASLHSGLNKIGDFKRHEKMLEQEMQQAGFTLIRKEKIGPKNKEVGGVFVYVFGKAIPASPIPVETF